MHIFDMLSDGRPFATLIFAKFESSLELYLVRAIETTCLHRIRAIGAFIRARWDILGSSISNKYWGNTQYKPHHIQFLPRVASPVHFHDRYSRRGPSS